MDKLLEFVRKTNPEMTEEKLLEKLKGNNYEVIALNLCTINTD